MTETQKQLAEKGHSIHALMQSYLDEKLGPIRQEVDGIKNSQLDGESKAALERITNDLLSVKKQFDMLQVALNMPKTMGGTHDQSLAEQRKTAFDKRLRMQSLTAEERKFVIPDVEAGIETKALYVAEAGSGGFLTVPEYVDQLLKNIVLISEMSGIVDMRVTSKPWIMTPKRTQTASAVRVAEQATRSETQNPRFGLVQNFPYESYAFTLISRTDLDDSELDLSSFVMAEFAEQFAKLQGNEFVNGLGSGSSQSFGFLNDTTINNNTLGSVTTAVTGAIDYPALVKLRHALKQGYWQNATFICTTETLGALMQLTDSQNRPLWVPMGQANPDTMFGRPIKIMPDMPQMASNGGSAGALAIAFGDFKAGYQGVVRKQVSMQVLNERYADQNAVGFFGYYRFGGTVKLSEAIKSLRIKP